MACFARKHFLLNPFNEFRFPSAPTMKSNSKLLTGWSAGSSLAVQPVFQGENVNVFSEKKTILKRCNGLQMSVELPLLLSGGFSSIYLTGAWISTPTTRAIFSSMHCSILIPVNIRLPLDCNNKLIV